MPDAPAAGSGAAPRSDAAVPVARCRCPRCAYALTGLPGAPAEPYGATTGRIRCPECALEIPPGAHCLVGGAAPDVVDPNGGRGVMAIAIGAAVLIGGPWICIMSVVVIREALRSTTLKNGIPMSALQGWMLGALPAAAGIGVAAWFLWRRWRGVDGSSGERAGARMRRAMVVPGGVHLWSGEPAGDAKPRSLAGGDIRDVRGRRHIPMFRKKGAGEAGAIDFVTPLVLWSANDAKNASNMSDGRFAGTIWLLMPEGVRPESLARPLERALRSAPEHAPLPVESKRVGAVDTPTIDGDPNRLGVPVAVTAGTVAEPPTCPRCSHRLASVPDGAWWEPLPAAVACPECGLAVPEGAIVISGFRHSGEARMKGSSRGWIVIAAGVALFAALFVTSMVLMVGTVSKVTAVVVQMIGVAALPIGIVAGTRMMMRPIARPRARFQRSTQTWIAEEGRLRIVTRGKPGTPVTVVPAKGISRVSFGQHFAADNSIPVQTDTLTVRGTARELGLMGECHLHVPIPAEVDCDELVAAVRARLGS